MKEVVAVPGVSKILRIIERSTSRVVEAWRAARMHVKRVEESLIDERLLELHYALERLRSVQGVYLPTSPVTGNGPATELALARTLLALVVARRQNAQRLGQVRIEQDLELRRAIHMCKAILMKL